MQTFAFLISEEKITLNQEQGDITRGEGETIEIRILATDVEEMKQRSTVLMSPRDYPSLKQVDL